MVIIGYIDFNFLTPLLPLPDDICFYHENKPPLWVDLFYLDGMGHIEPLFSSFHNLALLLLSVIIAIFTAKKIDIILLKREQK